MRAHRRRGGNSAGQRRCFSRWLPACARARALGRPRRQHVALTSSAASRRARTSPCTTRTQALGAGGAARGSSAVTWRNGTAPRRRDIGHVFLMTGAVPNTRWLQGCLSSRQGLRANGIGPACRGPRPAQWPHRASAASLRDSRPAIFAVGDVRCGTPSASPRRWARARACVQLVHRVLHE